MCTSRQRVPIPTPFVAEMEREGAGQTLHQRLLLELARAAAIHETSRAIIDANRAIDQDLLATLAAVRTAREQRVRGARFAIGHIDARNRFPSG